MTTWTCSAFGTQSARQPQSSECANASLHARKHTHIWILVCSDDSIIASSNLRAHSARQSDPSFRQKKVYHVSFTAIVCVASSQSASTSWRATLRASLTRRCRRQVRRIRGITRSSKFCWATVALLRAFASRCWRVTSSLRTFLRSASTIQASSSLRRMSSKNACSTSATKTSAFTTPKYTMPSLT
jgi:hypothetical protein